MNILITGCGGDIGISICNILKREGYENIYGSDVHTDHPADYFYKSWFVIPKATDKNYRYSLERIVEELDINLIIPTSEVELEFFLKENLTTIQNSKLLMVNFLSLEIGLDKYNTYSFLKENNLPYPWTMKADKALPKKFPCIYKPIKGAGSKSLQILNHIDSNRSGYINECMMFQEYIGDDNSEYTCGLFRSKNKDVREIIFKRKLEGGVTVSGIVVCNKSISNLLSKIATKLDLRGSINVQLRMHNSIPHVFEINPRFSSTVSFRHQLGFKDLLWSINDMFDRPIDLNFIVPDGKRIYRCAHELIL